MKHLSDLELGDGQIWIAPEPRRREHRRGACAPSAAALLATATSNASPRVAARPAIW